MGVIGWFIIYLVVAIITTFILLVIAFLFSDLTTGFDAFDSPIMKDIIVGGLLWPILIIGVIALGIIRCIMFLAEMAAEAIRGYIKKDV